MSSFRLPGPVCFLFNSLDIDAGTMCRTASYAPGLGRAPFRKLPPPLVEPPSTSGKTVIEGLAYPLALKATADYHSGARRFGSGRDNGRKHAGIDLYATKGTAVRALADGKVISVYPFYAGTYAIEIDHGSFIARYGEVDKSDANIFVAAGEAVKRGEQIAVVGKLVGIKVPSDMLHLELYSTTKKSALTVRSNKPFQRRLDLIDPTGSIDLADFE